MKKSNISIIKHIPDFLEYCDIGKGLAPLTIKNYHRFLIPFKKYLEKNNLKELLPHQLTQKHIWDYRIVLSRTVIIHSKNTLQKATQNYYLIALRNLLTYFAEKDITSLPPEKIKLSKNKTGKVIHFLTLEQIEKLILAPDTKNIQGSRDRSILEILFSTGLRVAELVNLNIDQFDLNKKGKDMEIVIMGKGNQPRTVYISERALIWLKKYIEKRTDDDNALFVNLLKTRSQKSRRLSSRSIENLIKKYCKIAGLPLSTTPHTIRHSYATDLLEQGVDLRTIQEFLGHKNIVTTQIYTHVTNKHLRDVHRAFHSGRKLKNE